jgi:hypothetical protein
MANLASVRDINLNVGNVDAHGSDVRIGIGLLGDEGIAS